MFSFRACRGVLDCLSARLTDGEEKLACISYEIFHPHHWAVLFLNDERLCKYHMQACARNNTFILEGQGEGILMQRETPYSTGFIPSVVYCLSYRYGGCGSDFSYTFIGLKGSNCATVFKYMRIQSADATVSISSNFKPELIRMNLYLMKLLAFLLAETHWHLILKLTGSYMFHFFYNTPWTFFQRVKAC